MRNETVSIRRLSLAKPELVSVNGRKIKYGFGLRENEKDTKAFRKRRTTLESFRPIPEQTGAPV